MSRRRFLSLLPQLAVLTAAPAFVRNAAAQEGLSAKSITVGSSFAMTGPQSGFGNAIKLGSDAAIAQINAKGGVQGRLLQLQALDDGYVPQRSVDNVKKMIDDGNVFALMSCQGTPNNAAILPLIEASNLPYLAPLSGSTSLRKSSSRNVFHVRASYTEETHRLMEKLLSMGIHNLGIAYMDNQFGKEILADATSVLTAHDMKPAVQAALAIDGRNAQEVATQIMAAKPAAVLLGTSGASSVALIAALKKISPLLPIAGLSVALVGDDFKNVGAASAGLALTMVFPNPYSARTPVVRDYQSAMRAVGSKEFSSGSLESYINTLVLAEALERAGRDVTRAKLRTALQSLQKFDLGGFVVDYSGAAPFVGSHYVDLGVLGANGRFLG